MNENLDYKYIDNKSDKTIVFLHGWGLDKNSFERIINRLPGECNILYLDFFGFGKSPEPPFSYDTYEYAYNVFMLLSHLHIERVYFVGHSFGGRIAIILSSVFKLNVCGLILTSSAGLRRFNLINFIKIKIYKLYKKLIKYGVIKNKKKMKFGSSDYLKLSDKMKMSFVKIINQDLSCLLPRIECSTRLIWGRNDLSTPMWICNKMFRLIKHSSKIIFKNGKHFACFFNVNKFVFIIDIMTKT